MEEKGFRVSMPKTKFMISGVGLDVLVDEGAFPYAVCHKGVASNYLLFQLSPMGS